MVDSAPEFMPSEFSEWVEAHSELLDHVVRIVLETGEWPLLTDLTRDFVRARKPTRVEAVFWDMPPALRYRTGHPERAVLSLLCLRLVDIAKPLLDGFYKALVLARERYETDDRPVLTSNDVAQLSEQLGLSPAALIEIVEREASFLGSTTPQTSAETWVREISTRIVDYWDATTIDEALSVRADEVRRSPTTHWPAEPAENRNRLLPKSPTIHVASSSHTRARTRPRSPARSPRG
jgi:hypothetical protein